MLYCPNFFCNVLQVWMTGKDVYLQMTWSWPDKTWNILCSYCLQWNTSQSKFRNHYFLFLFAFSILSQLFLIWGCMYIYIYTGLQTATKTIAFVTKNINLRVKLLLRSPLATIYIYMLWQKKLHVRTFFLIVLRSHLLLCSRIKLKIKRQYASKF